MAQVTIDGLATELRTSRAAHSDAIHRAVVVALEYPEDKRVHRFMALEREEFVTPPDRSDRNIIIEIAVFEGRSDAAKRDLILRLLEEIRSATGIQPQDVEIQTGESPAAKWGIRGHHAPDLALDDRVDVENARAIGRDAVTGPCRP